MFPTVKTVFVAPAVQFTWETCVGSMLDMKLLPVKVMLKGAAAPITAPLGAMLVRIGSGFGGGLMTNTYGLDRPFCPAPEAGLSVITVAVPTFATNAAGPAQFPLRRRCAQAPTECRRATSWPRLRGSLFASFSAENVQNDIGEDHA